MRRGEYPSDKMQRVLEFQGAAGLLFGAGDIFRAIICDAILYMIIAILT